MDTTKVSYEFNVTISHPSKNIPWKASGTGSGALVINQIKGMLLNATQLPTNPPRFEELCRNIVAKITHFETSDGQLLVYDAPENDYRIYFILTKIKESE